MSHWNGRCYHCGYRFPLYWIDQDKNEHLSTCAQEMKSKRDRVIVQEVVDVDELLGLLDRMALGDELGQELQMKAGRQGFHLIEHYRKKLKREDGG